MLFLSCPCCLVTESHLPAAVPGEAAAVLAEVSPPACCCAWRGSCRLSRSVPRPGQARGCLADFGLKGCPREEMRAREETVVLHVFARLPTLQAHGHSSHLVCTAQDATRSEVQGRKDKQGPMPEEFTLLTAQVFLPFFSYVFCLFFLLAA